LNKIVPRKIPCPALDIGAREIKFVSLGAGDDSADIKAVARYATPPDIFSDGINEDNLGAILEKLVEQYAPGGTGLVSIIGGDNVVTRYITLPGMPSRELKKAVLLEAQRVMPVSPEELVVRYITLGNITGENNKQQELIFAAVPRVLTYRYHAMFERAGLVLTALDLPAIALWRLYRKELSREERPAAIIDIGEAKTNLVICCRGKIKYIRTLPVGGYLLTKSMADTYGLDLKKARTMKEEEGAILNEEDLAGAGAARIQMDFSLRDGLGKLVKEIRRSLEFYSTMNGNAPVAKIMLSGGTSKLRGFDIFTSEALDLPAQVVIPSSINFEDSGYYAFDPSLAVAYGLALREVQ